MIKTLLTFLTIILNLKTFGIAITSGRVFFFYNFIFSVNSMPIILKLTTFGYLILIFNIYFFYLIKNYILYFQQIILDSICMCIYCLRLFVESKKYNLIVVTLTNLNLKNYFLLSGLGLYIFSSIYYIIKILKYAKYLTYFNIGKILFINQIFYFNDNSNTFSYLHNILLLNIILIISLHIVLGIYMFFFDYIKKSSFLLWTLLLMATNIINFYYIFKIKC